TYHHHHLHTFPTRRSSDLKATRNFLNSIDEASEANAKVRDLDIILSKLSTYKPDLSMEERISGIKETRESQLQAARRQTIALQRSEEHTSELQSLAYLVCR